MSKNIARFMFAFVVLFAARTAVASPLWGIDEDDGQLFSIDSQTFSVLDYGLLKYNDGGTLRDVGKNIEAFAIDTGGIAYMAINRGIGGYSEPVLLRLDLTTASTVTPNVVDLVGGINAGFTTDFDNITGLAFDGNGALLALWRRKSIDDADSLLVLDKNNGALLQERGRVENTALGYSSTNSEDMAFDRFGNLYVTDNLKDRLYRVDPITAMILELVDANERGGIGPNSLKIEALVFDPATGVLLGADDNGDQLIGISLATGGNVVLADLKALGLTDVEGLAAMPMNIPEPASLVMAMLGLFMIVGRRPRRRSMATV